MLSCPMAIRFVLFYASGLLASASASLEEQQQLSSALVLDGECTEGDEACALNALQVKGEAKHEVKSGEAQETEWGTSQCCLCMSGHVVWSGSGSCMECGGHPQRMVTPKKQCQAGHPAFLGGSGCISMCQMNYFPGATGGYQPGMPVPGGYHPGMPYDPGMPVMSPVHRRRFQPGMPVVPHPYSPHPPGGVCMSKIKLSSCMIFNCDKSRGPTVCGTDYSCHCQPGFCSDGQGCVPR